MVIIKKEEVKENIYLLKFKDQYSLTSTFLRFSEHYESPKFRGKVFSLNEFKQWYASTKKGKFTYYKDWNGFNIPSHILQPFYAGKFDPLTTKEKQLLKLFEDTNDQFYIIGIQEEKKSAFHHELAHALFYVNLDYRKKVLDCLLLGNITSFKKELVEKGYCLEVLDDEVNAYAVEGSKKFKTKIPSKLVHQLQKLFLTYSQENAKL